VTHEPARPAVAVEIVEVSPRDGLQSEPVLVSTADKLELVRRAASAGLRRIEVAAFARADRVPQMADAEEVLAGARAIAGIDPIVLVLNERSFQRAASAGAREINGVVLASEAFSMRNQGCTVDEAALAWARIAAQAADAGIRRGVTISAAFGCPFEGDIPDQVVRNLARRLLDAGTDEISLADTIGVAVPNQVEDLVGAVRDLGGRVRCHLHDTRNTGVANAVAAVRAGAVAIDASVGGIGGCPFAPAATGNTATEDLVFTFERMGWHTGVDLEGLIATGRWLSSVLDHPVGGAVAKAGAFPPASVVAT
jgi:hydroxymethylglutaryl-CoA lyase